MEQKKEKGLRIRCCLTGAIWLALVFSTVISALLFAFLNHFFNLPGSISVLGWLLIFNTLIAGLITSFINAKLANKLIAVINEEEFNPYEGILHHEEGVDILPANIELSGLEVSIGWSIV